MYIRKVCRRRRTFNLNKDTYKRTEEGGIDDGKREG